MLTYCGNWNVTSQKTCLLVNITLFGKGAFVYIICTRIWRWCQSGLGWALKPVMGVFIRGHERHKERKNESRDGNGTSTSQGTPRTAGFHKKS